MSSFIELRNITKRFGGITALANVSFEISAGEVHAIVGENGAGKSTLMKILAGVYPPDGGEVRLRGEPLRLRDPLDARRRGISVVFQELSLFPHLSVAANVFAGSELARGAFLNEHQMVRRAREILETLGCALDPRVPVARLGLGERQLVEIARALCRDAAVIVLDEPTSALTYPEASRLLGIVRRLRERRVTILYVSHRLEEVLAIADRITVLRDGRYQGTWPAGVSVDTLIEAMTGRRLGGARARTPFTRTGTPLLEVRELRGPQLGPVDFAIWPGEILGLAGLEGSGVDTVFAILFGLRAPAGGEVVYEGRPVRFRGPEQAVSVGIGFVPANRREQGLFMRWPLRANVSITVLDQIARNGGWLDVAVERRLAERSIRELGIVADSSEQRVLELSGGNQQKVVVAKWLHTRPRLLMMHDPTRGVDVGAKQEIYRLCRALAQRGLSILFASSELEEFPVVCDRILAFYRGRIVRTFEPEEASKDLLLRWVTGAA